MTLHTLISLWAAGVAVAVAPVPPQSSAQSTAAGSGESREVGRDSGSESATAPAPESGKTYLRTRDFEIRDWFALGSGCRARPPEIPGDVALELLTPLDKPGQYAVKVRLPKYGIRREDEWFQVAPEFARECGVRLAVYPAAGMKLRDVVAQPSFQIDKPEGSKVRLRSRLVVGDATLSAHEQWLEAPEVASHAVRTMKLHSDRGQSVFEGLKCEQPKVIGLDLSTAVYRNEKGPGDVSVLPDDGSVEIVLNFESCGGSLPYQGHSKNPETGVR